MRTDTEPLLVQVQAVTAAATPLGEVPVEVVRLERIAPTWWRRL